MFTACLVAAPATVTGGQFTVGERACTRHTQASMACNLTHPQDVCTRCTHDSCERRGPGWLDCPCARAADWPHSHTKTASKKIATSAPRTYRKEHFILLNLYEFSTRDKLSRICWTVCLSAIPHETNIPFRNSAFNGPRGDTITRAIRYLS